MQYLKAFASVYTYTDCLMTCSSIQLHGHCWHHGHKYFHLFCFWPYRGLCEPSCIIIWKLNWFFLMLWCKNLCFCENAVYFLPMRSTELLLGCNWNRIITRQLFIAFWVPLIVTMAQWEINALLMCHKWDKLVNFEGGWMAWWPGFVQWRCRDFRIGGTSTFLAKKSWQA